MLCFGIDSNQSEIVECCGLRHLRHRLVRGGSVTVHKKLLKDPKLPFAF